MARPKRPMPRVPVFLNLDPINPVQRNILAYAAEIASRDKVFSNGQPYLRYGIEELLREGVERIEERRLQQRRAEQAQEAGDSQDRRSAPSSLPPEPAVAAAPVQPPAPAGGSVAHESAPAPARAPGGETYGIDFLGGPGESKAAPDTNWLADLVESQPAPTSASPVQKEPLRKPAAMAMLNLGVNTDAV